MTFNISLCMVFVFVLWGSCIVVVIVSLLFFSFSCQSETDHGNSKNHVGKYIDRAALLCIMDLCLCMMQI